MVLVNNKVVNAKLKGKVEMKFLIYNTSDSRRNKLPCKNAVFSYKTFWGISIYEIEINSIEDLVKISEEIDEEIIIIPSSQSDSKTCELEVYNGNRE